MLFDIFIFVAHLDFNTIRSGWNTEYCSHLCTPVFYMFSPLIFFIVCTLYKWLLNYQVPNLGEAGSWLKICHQGDYLSTVTLVESKPNLKFDESNLSYSTSSRISSQILSWILSPISNISRFFKYKSRVFSCVYRYSTRG